MSKRQTDFIIFRDGMVLHDPGGEYPIEEGESRFMTKDEAETYRSGETVRYAPREEMN